MVPKCLIPEILYLAHDSPASAHPGFMKTTNKIRKHYFWHNMRKHVLNHIKSCISCVKKRGFKKGDKAPLQRMPIPTRPFERIAIDAVGPLTVTLEGNRHVLVISDYFSRWVEAYPVRNVESETVAVVLEKFIATHGVPEHIVSDKGKAFLSDAIQQVYENYHIKKHTTTSYHPSSDGVVERANATIINALKHLVTATDYQWDKYLSSALLAYRTSYHSTIQDTPAHIVYGRDLVIPVDLLNREKKFSYADTREYSEDIEMRLKGAFNIVRENLEKAAEKQESYRNRTAKDKKIMVGDLVMLYTPAFKKGQARKFQDVQKGPYRVKSKTSPVNFQIMHINNPKDIQLIHVDRLTRLEERITFPYLYETENKDNIESQIDTPTDQLNVNDNINRISTSNTGYLPKRKSFEVIFRRPNNTLPITSNASNLVPESSQMVLDTPPTVDNDEVIQIDDTNTVMPLQNISRPSAVPAGQGQIQNVNKHTYNLRTLPKRSYRF